jgi:hypothetical protein
MGRHAPAAILTVAYFYLLPRQSAAPLTATPPSASHHAPQNSLPRLPHNAANYGDPADLKRGNHDYNVGVFWIPITLRLVNGKLIS